MELHGGTVEAASGGPGRGAAFTVRLPLKGEAPALAESSAPPAPSGAPPLRILVVEDNRDAADSLRMLLELLGHQVAVAYDGPAGIGLPGLDG